MVSYDSVLNLCLADFYIVEDTLEEADIRKADDEIVQVSKKRRTNLIDSDEESG